MHTYMHTYIHTYIHTYLHTYIHTYIHQWIYTNMSIASSNVAPVVHNTLLCSAVTKG